MIKKIFNTPTSTISEVKKSPMDVFGKSYKENEGIYILNRKNIVGVILAQEKYESLIKENDYLNDRIVELLAEKRLLKKNLAVISDIEVRGSAIANKKTVINKTDDFE